jgi:hypothetical protein
MENESPSYGSQIPRCIAECGMRNARTPNAKRGAPNTTDLAQKRVGAGEQVHALVQDLRKFQEDHYGLSELANAFRTVSVSA